MAPFARIEEFRKRINRLSGLALDIIFPVECFGCGREGEWICSECFLNLPFKDSQYCLGCKAESRLGEFCADCRRRYHLDGVLIAGDYENELLAKSIKNIKYHLVKQAAEIIGNYLAAFLVNETKKLKVSLADLKAGRIWEKVEGAQDAPGLFFNLEEALIIPVPLHPRRERSRGFNQADIIARTAAHNLSIPYSTGALIRVKQKTPQAKLGEEERKKNIIGCYGWSGGRLGEKDVLLVDDVATTGATLNECAKTLKANGARTVWGLVVAKG
ncbi:MAG: ComF family protein [Patescibacteria group bacterium]|jgi:ComF family protein